MPLSLEQLVTDAAAGDGSARSVRAAARLMTLVENQPHRLPELFKGMAHWPEPRLILGITGAPGSGKSSLTDRLISEFRRRYPDRRLGVIAVDPSSPFTGGAVLGDRVRMMNHATDRMVFIRSLASRGHLGGLSLGVKGVLRVMGLAQCDAVILETVGVGQSEIEVTKVADQVLVVLAPGQGDSIQMLKAGLMEIADLFVVNKADQAGASHLHSTLLAALNLAHVDEQCGAHHGIQIGGQVADGVCVDTELADAVLSRGRERPEVLLTSASEGTGISELFDGLEKRIERSRAHWQARREAAMLDDVRESILEEARQRISQRLGANGSSRTHLQRILRGEASVEQVAGELIDEAAKKS